MLARRTMAKMESAREGVRAGVIACVVNMVLSSDVLSGPESGLGAVLLAQTNLYVAVYIALGLPQPLLQWSGRRKQRFAH